MPTSCMPPSPFPSRSIRQLKERVANLRVKHDQIYNFPLQHIEPQVNWSTVIEEKQVPRGPPVPLPGQQHQLLQLSMEKLALGKLLGSCILGAANSWVAGQGQRRWDKASCCGTSSQCSRWHWSWPQHPQSPPASGSTPQPLFFILSHSLHCPSQRRV